jgi:hypothetical protein
MAALALSVLPLGAQTYYKDIAPIVQNTCQRCHQPGNIAPMALLTADDVTTWAADIQTVLSNHTMPPWKPIPGYGDFRNSYGITDDQRLTFLNWIANGTPPGDPADAPPAPVLSGSPWQLGNPDLTYTLPAYTPPFRQADTYRCFSVPTGVTANSWINAMQAVPGATQEVHHIVVFLDQSGQAAASDGKDGQPGYDCFGSLGFGNDLTAAIGGMVGAWVPGSQVSRLDTGIGILVPANANLVVQIHYHPSGRVTPDQTQIGLYLAAPDSVQHRLISLPLANTGFKIPVGDAHYKVTASFQVPPFLSGKAVLVLPHMHLLGKQIAVDKTDAKKNVTPMIRIDDWDFKWQGQYFFTQPIPISAGDSVSVESYYDNSDQNPKNPNNPIVPVGWGEGTNDEMCVALIGVILDNEALIRLIFGI